MSGVDWEDPPEGGRRSRGGSTYWQAVTAELKAHEGKWAKLSKRSDKQNVHQDAHRINAGAIAAVKPAGSFEAVARTVDGEAVLFVRYLGESQEDEPQGADETS